MLDERLIAGLHLRAERREDVGAAADPDEIFQSSTVAALLDGRFEGDLSFAELARHGNLGLGTLNALDGEMIALDGEFWRADADGDVTAVPASAKTPFAVVIAFHPKRRARFDQPLGFGELKARIDELAGAGSPAYAIRLDGEFEHLHLRSVPRQSPPYRSLTEVAREQNEFELRDVRGTLVGFRFPAWAEGVELAGHHLHFIDADRTRGGHVLGCALRSGEVAIDDSHDLHLELPSGVELPDGTLGDEAAGALHRAE